MATVTNQNIISNAQSITIYPGQDAYIPKNAIIIGVNNTGDSTPDSDCVDLDNVEQFTCYTVLIGEANHGGSGPTPTYEDVTVIGIEYNDTFFAIPNPLNVQAGNLDSIMDQIKNIPGIGSLFIDSCTTNHNDASRGGISGFNFKTLPSIAKVSRFVANASDTAFNTTIRVKFPLLTPTEQVAVDPDNNIIFCGCASASVA